MVIVGGGNSGLEASLDMTKIGCKVDLIEFNEELSGDEILKEKVQAHDSINVYTGRETKEIKGKEQVESLVMEDRKTGQTTELKTAAVFIQIGFITQ